MIIFHFPVSEKTEGILQTLECLKHVTGDGLNCLVHGSACLSNTKAIIKKRKVHNEKGEYKLC